VGCRASSTKPLGRCAPPRAHEGKGLQLLFVGADWAEDHHDVCGGLGTGVFRDVWARIRSDSSATNRQREYPGPAPCTSHDPWEQIATSGCGRSGGATTTGGRAKQAGRNKGDRGSSSGILIRRLHGKCLRRACSENPPGILGSESLRIGARDGRIGCGESACLATPLPRRPPSQ
jgi:hypothetical protein